MYGLKWVRDGPAMLVAKKTPTSLKESRGKHSTKHTFPHSTEVKLEPFQAGILACGLPTFRPSHEALIVALFVSTIPM